MSSSRSSQPSAFDDMMTGLRSKVVDAVVHFDADLAFQDNQQPCDTTNVGSTFFSSA